MKNFVKSIHSNCVIKAGLWLWKVVIDNFFVKSRRNLSKWDLKKIWRRFSVNSNPGLKCGQKIMYIEQLLCKINTFIIFRQINWDLELSWFWNNALIFVNSHWLYWLKWSQNHERVKSKIGNVPKFSWNQKRRSFYLSMKLSPICEFSGHSLQSISLTLVWEKFRESNVFRNELLYIELIWRSFF